MESRILDVHFLILFTESVAFERESNTASFTGSVPLQWGATAMGWFSSSITPGCDSN